MTNVPFSGHRKILILRFSIYHELIFLDFRPEDSVYASPQIYPYSLYPENNGKYWFMRIFDQNWMVEILNYRHTFFCKCKYSD